MTTGDLIQALRSDIAGGLKEQILAELQPEIDRRLYANIFLLDEAAKYLKISENTLRRMCKKGEVPHFRIRGILHFRQIDLDTHIDKLTKGECP
ncbi:Helix-turn-helix domain protein [compost metagenome]